MHPQTGPAPWLWPNLLSLDAPIVAVLWQILFARCFHSQAGVLPALVLVLTVWLIYSADRILDAWRGQGCSPRHQFGYRHRRTLALVWLMVVSATAWLASNYLPRRLFIAGLSLLVAVLIYFLLVHVVMAHVLRRPWPKEAVVGALFALGASLVVWADVKTMADAASILLFACLCWMNCAAIQEWESDHAARFIGLAAIFIAVAASVLLYANRPVLGGAELASAFAFLLLNCARRRLSLNALRVLADVALLSPVVFLPVSG